MKHNITLSTIEILLINKALRLDMQNDTDNEISEKLIDKINGMVAKDLKKQKPTDFTDKCGSCKWAKQRGSSSFIDCTCPYKSPNWFSRTKPKCKRYEIKE